MDDHSSDTVDRDAAAVGAEGALRDGASPVPRASRAWIWALVVVLALCSLCSLASIPFAFMAGTGGGTPDLGTVPGQGRVAVINLTTPIGGVDTGLFGGATASPERIIKQLRKAELDPTVKAVLLRIDSPGGTASASEEIAQAVAASRKPVIASIGDVGASGAYMVAAQSKEIWATGASSVGSIGVILSLTEYPELLKKLGITQFSITAGKYKDAGAPYRSLTATEKAMLQENVDLIYGQFVDWVAKGRKMPRDKVLGLATGWVWPGSKAKELGLVDHVGNYTDALLAAGKAGGITGYPAVVDYGQGGLGDLLGSLSESLSGLAVPAAPWKSPAPSFGEIGPAVPR
jgi:protease-4